MVVWCRNLCAVISLTLHLLAGMSVAGIIDLLLMLQDVWSLDCLIIFRVGMLIVLQDGECAYISWIFPQAVLAFCAVSFVWNVLHSQILLFLRCFL